MTAVDDIRWQMDNGIGSNDQIQRVTRQTTPTKMQHS
jgi:hypothetical protein